MLLGFLFSVTEKDPPSVATHHPNAMVCRRLVLVLALALVVTSVAVRQAPARCIALFELLISSKFFPTRSATPWVSTGLDLSRQRASCSSTERV